MLITIHQPDFLPWLGFFERWQQSQLYIILDDVQFIRRGWQHRDKIKTPSGVQWLTLPIQKKGNYKQLIRDVRLEEGLSWRKKHLNTIKSCYGKAPYFECHYPFLEQIYLGPSKFLMEFNILLLNYTALRLNITTSVQMASEFNCIQLKSTQRLVELTLKAGGKAYLTGMGSKNYLDEENFYLHGVQVVWQKFKQTEYQQLHGAFQTGLSVLDYLMMEVDDKHGLKPMGTGNV